MTATKQSPEACICGTEPAEGKTFPMVAVLNGRDAPQDRIPLASKGVFVALPVCHRCYHAPDQRPVPIKAHFFPRTDLKAAIWKAGSSDKVGA